MWVKKVKKKYNKKIVLPENVTLQLVCSFMKHLFVFTESSHNLNEKHYLKYNIKTLQWSNIANQNFYRKAASCAIFEGKIVVSGGVNSRIVEEYDYYEDCWTLLPRMNEKRENHGAVSMGNKMFVIGGWKNLTCEVFDSSSRKFTNIQKMFLVNNLDVESNSVFGIGGKITVFFERAHSVVNKLIQTYDVLENKWYLEDDFIGDIDYVISCSKLPVA